MTQHTQKAWLNNSRDGHLGADMLSSLNGLESDITALNDTTHWSSISFAETAGAGTYTGTVTIPTSSYIVHVSYKTTVAWGADTTALDAGYTGALTAFASAVDIDGVGQATLAPVAALAPTAHASGTTFTAVVTTTGAGTTAGRSVVLVGYVTPTAATAPTKA